MNLDFFGSKMYLNQRRQLVDSSANAVKYNNSWMARFFQLIKLHHIDESVSSMEKLNEYADNLFQPSKANEFSLFIWDEEHGFEMEWKSGQNLDLFH